MPSRNFGPEGVLWQTNFFVQDPNLTFYSVYAYHKGILAGEMLVWTDIDERKVAFKTHLFYGDGCAVEIKENIGPGVLYDREEIIYPQILTPEHFDFGFEARQRQTHYSGEVRKNDSSGRFSQLLENLPPMFVTWHHYEFVSNEGVDYILKEEIKNVDYPRSRRMDISLLSSAEKSQAVKWYAYITSNYSALEKNK
ncbi:TPA: hypothetical protein DIV55_07020 [Patescibacteria group bacterium]|uniref:Uncharacterized protein n=1 Tax=Candidatus Gottesmanbacteria bacterium GW2011_GWA1_43_11 TaxID=1618436 RepID=A0A0G1FEG0_9BACT|nr:MAG: hypothetical protein UV59_C0009G0035 [Candidatus Gottesmanbacteria bacterium GW2011_GWA1_43_11]HCS79455.1 hypothetical protein [Patescibacteria group bacterium]